MPSSLSRLLPGAAHIQGRMLYLARNAVRCDMISYWVGMGNFVQRLSCEMPKGSRILIGGIGEVSKAVTFASANPGKFEVRYLEGCHVKLYIFRGPPNAVVLGSMNLGAGNGFELAVEINNSFLIKDCMHYFQQLWDRATPVNALCLPNVAASLANSSFESSGTD